MIGQSGPAWARNFCQDFFAEFPTRDQHATRMDLLADLMAYDDARISIARLAYLGLELSKNWTPAQAYDLFSFVHSKAVRFGTHAARKAAMAGNRNIVQLTGAVLCEACQEAQEDPGTEAGNPVEVMAGRPGKRLTAVVGARRDGTADWR